MFGQFPPNPLTVPRLAALTGYCKRTVRKALALLVELRLAGRCPPRGRNPPTCRPCHAGPARPVPAQRSSFNPVPLPPFNAPQTAIDPRGFLNRIARFWRKAPQPAGLSLTLPPELSQALAGMARRSRVDPAVLVDQLLREALERRRLVESVKGRWKILSPREREVARLAGQGLRNPEIGGRLCISPETVRTHLTSALHKLDLSRKAELREALEDFEWDDQGS